MWLRVLIFLANFPLFVRYRPIMEDFYPEVDWEDNYAFYQAFYILDCGA